jgi:hypothetical protein
MNFVIKMQKEAKFREGERETPGIKLKFYFHKES